MGQRFCVLCSRICTPSLFFPPPPCGAKFKTKHALNLRPKDFVHPCSPSSVLLILIQPYEEEYRIPPPPPHTQSVVIPSDRPECSIKVNYYWTEQIKTIRVRLTDREEVNASIGIEGASIKDVHKYFGFFDHPRPCPHLELIYSTKSLTASTFP